MKQIIYLVYFIFLSFVISNVAYAQLGQQAGPLIFNITLGENQTLNYSILNSGSSPLNFTVITPKLNTIPNNETPIIKIYPMNGTIAPHSQQIIHVTVYIPSNNEPGLTWNGGYEKNTSGIIVMQSTALMKNAGMGANIYAAVMKGITIYSIQPVNTTLNLYIFIDLIILIIILIIIIILYKKFKNRRIHEY
jgi:hypothetical protein